MSHRHYAHTPDPTAPEPDDEPHKVPVEPPAEPPDPNPVRVAPGGRHPMNYSREWRAESRE